MIYTTGYQGRTIYGLALAIELARAQLIDIRYRPMSMQPQWRKSALSQFFGGKYHHMPEFGNVAYKQEGVIQLQDPKRGVARLTGEFNQKSVVLMCACREYEGCHRKAVAKILRDNGIDVEELTYPSKGEIDAFQKRLEGQGGLF